MWTDRETSAVGHCQGHAYKHTLAPECFYSHIHATLSLKWASVPSVTLLHLTPTAGRFTWINQTCSLDTLQNRKWIQCLSWNSLSATAVHTHTHTHREREREEVTNSTALCHQPSSLTSCNNHQIE